MLFCFILYSSFSTKKCPAYKNMDFLTVKEVVECDFTLHHFSPLKIKQK